MDQIESTFSLADYLVLAAVLLISSIIGLYYRYVTSPQTPWKEDPILCYSVHFLNPRKYLRGNDNFPFLSQ